MKVSKFVPNKSKVINLRIVLDLGEKEFLFRGAEQVTNVVRVYYDPKGDGSILMHRTVESDDTGDMRYVLTGSLKNILSIGGTKLPGISPNPLPSTSVKPELIARYARTTLTALRFGVPRASPSEYVAEASEVPARADTVDYLSLRADQARQAIALLNDSIIACANDPIRMRIDEHGMIRASIVTQKVVEV